MDKKKRELIQEQLDSLPSDASERLIIHAEPATPKGVPPEPDQFSSRVDYRKALIDFEAQKDRPALDGLIKRMETLGLQTKVSRQSETIVVEGPPDALSRALEEDGVENAAFDAEIELIKPVRRDSE